MKKDREIIDRINYVVKSNLSKIVISLVMMMLLSTASISLVSLPMLIPIPSFFMILFLILAGTILVFLYYGFSVLMGNFYLQQQPIIGNLFAGKNDLKRIFQLALILFGVMFAVFSIGIIPYTFSSMSKFDTSTEKGLMDFFTSTTRVTSIIAIVGMIIICAIFLPYALILPVMYNNRELTIGKVFRESRMILKGRVFKFLWFTIKAAKYPLITWITAFLFTIFVKNNVLASICSFLASISQYYAIIYIIISMNAYYYELTAKYDETDTEDDSCLYLPDDRNQD